MLTALDAVADRVTGLRAGAADYLGKPSSFVELLARLEALARRGVRPPADLRAGSFWLEPSTYHLRCGDRAVLLTAREFALMELFCRHLGQVLTRERIAAALWDEPWETSDNLIEERHEPVVPELAPASGHRYGWCWR